MKTIPSIRCAVALVALACLAADATNALEDGPSCGMCLDAGYTYLCTATLVDEGCLENAGMARCWGNRCACCKRDPILGSCEDCLITAVRANRVAAANVADMAKILLDAVDDPREPAGTGRDEEEL